MGRPCTRAVQEARSPGDELRVPPKVLRLDSGEREVLKSSQSAVVCVYDYGHPAEVLDSLSPEAQQSPKLLFEGMPLTLAQGQRP